jgi:hypothetical protein
VGLFGPVDYNQLMSLRDSEIVLCVVGLFCALLGRTDVILLYQNGFMTFARHRHKYLCFQKM